MARHSWRDAVFSALAIGLAACASQPASPSASASLPPPSQVSTPTPAPPVEERATPHRRINVVSFNIKFLGHYRARDNEGLADLLSRYDLIFIQELISPPGRGDPEVDAFFDAMRRRGFDDRVASGRTGPTMSNVPTSAEAPVVFYRPEVVSPEPGLASGYIDTPARANPDFDRVPYAFGFRSGSEDLVFISVHLERDPNRAGAVRRARELAIIWRWIAEQTGSERDYVVLGDMNMQRCDEVRADTPSDVSVLGGCQMTNVRGDRPYDQVMIRPSFTSDEIPGGLSVVNLVEAMRGRWDPSNGPLPGHPFNRRFERIYSDHNPISFQIEVDGQDDD